MLNISTLQDYVKLYPELLTNIIFRDTIVRRFANSIETWTNEEPGQTLMRIFEPQAHLADCCTTPDGESDIVEKMVEAICLMDGQEFCETDLAKILRKGDMRFTAGMENAGSIEQVITEGQIAAFVEAIDKLIFQGDKASADTNLNKYDGLLKQATANGVTVNVTTGDMYDALKQLIAALPVNARRQGQVAVFVGEEYADAIQASYINRNLYHYNSGTYEAYSDNTILGYAGFTVIPTPGLTGTNQILVTPLKNIVWITNRQDDMVTLDWDYSKYHQKYYFRIKTIFGVTFKIDEWAVVGTIDPAVLTNAPSVNVSIVNPLGANGGVLTTDTP